MACNRDIFTFTFTHVIGGCESQIPSGRCEEKNLTLPENRTRVVQPVAIPTPYVLMVFIKIIIDLFSCCVDGPSTLIS
jgi:hypothetical protein